MSNGRHRGPLLIIRHRCRSRDYPWMSDPGAYRRDVTAAAAAGVRRSARNRRRRHEKAWGLLAPVVAGPPPVETVEERVALFNERIARAIQRSRDRAAADWRRARARLREIPRPRTAELLEEWNARKGTFADGNAWPVDLLVFLDMREPTAERVAEMREARRRRARISRTVAEESHTWWIQHVGCPEGEEAGVAEIRPVPRRSIVCIGCERTWWRKDMPLAEQCGELRIVDCRLAVQVGLDLT
jgi:hypothetical protein